MSENKSLGSAIDEIITALSALPEPSRIIAIRAACSELDIEVADAVASITESQQPMGVATDAPLGTVPTAGTDIRTLKEQKNPSNAIEMALVLAYYLQHFAPLPERKTQIAAADINKYFVQADFPLPKRADQLLVDARAAGYFDSPSRGVYALNPVGHNLVAHSLPRATGSSGKVGSRRTSSKSGAKKRRPRPKK
jgi:hypothetical protein